MHVYINFGLEGGGEFSKFGGPRSIHLSTFPFLTALKRTHIQPVGVIPLQRGGLKVQVDSIL